MPSTEFIRLKKANCVNCYKCIRHCPVKAIRFSGGQAHIINNEWNIGVLEMYIKLKNEKVCKNYKFCLAVSNIVAIFASL